MQRPSRGQGALEYLLIVGGALVLGAIVVVLLSQSSSAGQSAVSIPLAKTMCQSKTNKTSCETTTIPGLFTGFDAQIPTCASVCCFNPTGLQGLNCQLNSTAGTSPIGTPVSTLSAALSAAGCSGTDPLVCTGTLTLPTSGVFLLDREIQNTSSTARPVISITNSDTILDCGTPSKAIKSNSAINLTGIQINNPSAGISNVIIRNCVLDGMNGNGFETGILAFGSGVSPNHAENIQFLNNTLTSVRDPSTGISVSVSGNVAISNNTINAISTGIGFLTSWSQTPNQTVSIRRNTINLGNASSGSSTGMNLGSSGVTANGMGFQLEDNTVNVLQPFPTNTTNSGILVQPTAAGVWGQASYIRNNTITFTGSTQGSSNDTGIRVGNGNNMTVENNTITLSAYNPTASDRGIWVFNNAGTNAAPMIHSNTIIMPPASGSPTTTHYGIHAAIGNGYTINNNQIQWTGQNTTYDFDIVAGNSVTSNGFSINNNTVTAGTGRIKVIGGTASVPETTITGNGNNCSNPGKCYHCSDTSVPCASFPSSSAICQALANGIGNCQ